MKKKTVLITCALFAVLPYITSAAEDSYLQPIEWTFDENNPVIRPGQLHGDFDAKRVSCCSVLQLGDIYRMYYWAEDAQSHYYIAQAETQIERPHRWQRQ